MGHAPSRRRSRDFSMNFAGDTFYELQRQRRQQQLEKELRQLSSERQRLETEAESRRTTVNVLVVVGAALGLGALFTGRGSLAIAAAVFGFTAAVLHLRTTARLRQQTEEILRKERALHMNLEQL